MHVQTRVACALQAGQIAAAEGVSGLVLHTRTVDQQYSPPCHWQALAHLVAAVPDNVPVIGNGDVYEAADAVEMMRQTGCKGKKTAAQPRGPWGLAVPLIPCYYLWSIAGRPIFFSPIDRLRPPWQLGQLSC